MRQKKGWRTTKETTALAGVVVALLAGSAAADSGAPLRVDSNSALCDVGRRSASDGPSDGCARINGYIAASADSPTAETAGGRFSLTRPRTLIPGPYAPAKLDPGFLPVGSGGTR